MATATSVLLPLLLAAACRCQTESSFEEPLHSDVALSELEREGRDQYQQAVERISMPQSGTCWKQAVAALQGGCRQLDEKTHGDLALQFSDCFLEMSGLEKHNCQFEDKACLREMNQIAFDTYSKFYIHTQSMCYFLYNQAWHQETEKTIARLTTTSSKMSQQLQESAEVQSKMLSDLLLVSTVVGQVSTVLLAVQNLLLSGSSFFGTVLFFTVAAVALAALGRTRSGSSVVPHMFAVLFAGAIVETVIANWFADDAATHYQWVWYLRCFETILCTVLLGYAAWRYQHYGPANNRLLKMIDNKIDRVLVAVLSINKVKGPLQSTCVKCGHNNGTYSDNAYYNISQKKEKSLPGMYENSKREETEDKPSIFSQSAYAPFLPQHTPVAADSPSTTRWAKADFTGSFETRYSRRSSLPRRSPTPFVDAQQVVAPPPPYDYVDLKSEARKDTTAPLTRRDFYTPERETRSSTEVKKAVVRIEPLKTQVSAPTPQSQAPQTPEPPRRQTPTRKVRQARSDSEQKALQPSSEYSLRSHNRDTGSIA
ncbi:uncharacterized protein LOC124717033 [Schistocerca piceifrons]|uniref:uncharacterized protein LOC124717033 n=1 Tax=Schistocerca piceifrons TaxID=274613 RepID=UPI001F5F3EE7|nr:uncharacterized protein LOC124717033 [Schistocerca piceifrons]XP_047099646.1 uncharacterized protein LOC124717033 [Schistocerca piceifrons]